MLESMIERPLLVSGGFPCQDVSSAGTAAGVANGKRSGLWAEFARVIDEFKPEHVLIENSALLRSRGLDVVLHDLVDLGYDARWDCIPAAAVGAPHLRDRIFVVAWRQFPEWNEPDDADECIATWRFHGGVGDPSTGEPITKLPRAGSMTNGYIYEDEPQYPRKNYRRRPWPTPTKSDGTGGPGVTPKRTGGKNLRTAVAESDGNGRLNPEWVEWLMGLPIGWTDPNIPSDALDTPLYWDTEPLAITRTVLHRAPDRSKRIQALGNGLVWPCAEIALSMIPEGE
jgi:site-specific DNA-cytosine methylase